MALTLPEQIEAALKAANSVGPHAYEMTGLEEELKRIYGPDYKYSGKVSIIFIGCQGSGDKSQEEVAKLADEIAVELAKEGKPVILLYFLGDNGYDNGFHKVDHEGFTKCFDSKYGDEALKILNKIRAFLITGNHDDNIHKKSAFAYGYPKIGKQTGIFQVARHYFLGDTEKRVHVFSQTKLPFSDITEQYNMPARYYSQQIGNLQILGCNSNSLAKSFLKLHKGQVKPDKINQAAFLRDEAKKAKEAGRELIITSHILPKTCGKRAFSHSYDTNLYLTEDQIKELNEILGTNTRSNNELIGAIAERLGLEGTFIGAHDHFLNYYNNVEDNTPDVKKSVVITSGGGGGPKQEQWSQKGYPYENHMEGNGLTVVSFDPENPKELEIELRNTWGQRLAFTNASHKPKCEPTDVQIKLLRDVINDACSAYFARSKEEELRNAELPQAPPQVVTPTIMTSLFNLAKDYTPTVISSAATTIINEATKYLTHDKNKTKELQQVNFLRTHFNQPILPDLKNLINYLKEKQIIFKNFPHKDEANSFNSILKAKLNTKLQQCDDKDKELLNEFLTPTPPISPNPPRV